MPGQEAQRRTVVTIEDDGYYMQVWRIIEHIGTHVDAPGHFTPGGRLAPELRPSELIVPAVVVDIVRRAARDPDTVVTVVDLRAFERRHGRIPRGAAVLMHSGWAAKVGDPAAYRNPDASGTLHFPGQLDHFDTHLILSAADRYGLENLANLDRLPRPHPLRGGLGRPGPHLRLLVGRGRMRPCARTHPTRPTATCWTAARPRPGG